MSMTRERKLKVIQDEWRDCAKCPAMVNSPIIFGYGNPRARLIFIGGSPRTDIETEDMLDSILAAVKIKREDIWITNTCLCRAPEVDERSRAPKKKEIENCRPRLQKELGIVGSSKKIIVLAGAAPLLMATGKRGVVKNRGWHIKPGDSGPAGTHFTMGMYSTLHPSSFFSGSAEQILDKKRMAWEDWKEIAKSYHEMEKNES